MRIRHIKGVEALVAAEPLIIAAPEKYRGKWRGEVFGSDRPIYLEIGMGMGTFIRTHSLLHPEISYIGLELNATVLYKAVCRYRELLKDTAAADDVTGVPSGAGMIPGTDADQGITAGPGPASNLRFIRSNARFLAEYFDKDEIDRIYLNFSDPWPKKHSAGRRLTSPQFLALYAQILKKEGCIEFKTDNRGLFDYSVETIPACGWRITEITYDLHRDPVMNEGNIMTEYEAKFSAIGNPIFKLIARREI